LVAKPWRRKANRVPETQQNGKRSALRIASFGAV
jgi:hypothetical protein